MDGAVHKELFDHFLVRECLGEPESQLYVLLERVSNHIDEEWDYCAGLGPYSYGEAESDFEFEDFELICGAADNLQISTLCHSVVLV